MLLTQLQLSLDYKLPLWAIIVWLVAQLVSSIWFISKLSSSAERSKEKIEELEGKMEESKTSHLKEVKELKEAYAKEVGILKIEFKQEMSLLRAELKDNNKELRDVNEALIKIKTVMEMETLSRIKTEKSRTSH